MDKTWVLLAGAAHFGLVAVGSQVPRVFRFREILAPLGAAPRRLIWSWGAFIVLANLGFGGLSLAYAGELAAGKGLAGGLALFIGLYWAARLVFQYAAFTTPDWPRDGGAIVKHGLGLLFLALTLVYLAAFEAGRRT
ncbi:MAG TPA: hypothetical protein VKW04_08490 [Planctomycetota bacterium]|nr:hypothetical protein [Planctomycetota bacterium]